MSIVQKQLNHFVLQKLFCFGGGELSCGYFKRKSVNSFYTSNLKIVSIELQKSIRNAVLNVVVFKLHSVGMSFLFLILMLMSSCKKKDIPTFGRDNIVGTWNLIEVVQEFHEDTLFSEYSHPQFKIDFYEDGSGINHWDFFGLSEPREIEWKYQCSPEQVRIITFYSLIVSLIDTTFYEVIKNDPKRQIWESNRINQNDSTITYIVTWKMDKIE